MNYIKENVKEIILDKIAKITRDVNFEIKIEQEDIILREILSSLDFITLLIELEKEYNLVFRDNFNDVTIDSLCDIVIEELKVKELRDNEIGEIMNKIFEE